MTYATRRLDDQLAARDETLDQIRGTLALVDIERLADAIDRTAKGHQLRQALTNLARLAG